MFETAENQENNRKNRQNGTLESLENGGVELKPNANSTKANEVVSEVNQNEIQNTELEPCLDSKNSSKSNSYREYLESYVSDIQKRTGLSRKGVFLVGLLVIFALLLSITVISMTLAWPYIPHKFQYQVCSDPACLRASAQIAETLNPSLSPCHDLWGAFCDGWGRNITRPSDKSVWNQKWEMGKKDHEKIRNLISTLPLPLRTGTVEWKLKYLYEACMDVDSLNQEEARTLRTVISELGGWYILRDWNDYDFDGLDVLKKIQVKYGVSPYFEIHVEPNPHLPSSSSIRISPSGLGLPDREYYYRDENDRMQLAYREYIRDVITYLSSPKKGATKFGQDIFSYEKRIAEITPDLATLQNPVSTYNAVTLGELQQTNLINFYEILQTMYPEGNITENTEVLVTSIDYLNQVSQIIATTDKRTMNGYLMWTLVRSYVPYMSDSFTGALDSFKSELFGISNPSERWEQCSLVVRNHMGLAVEYLLEKSSPISNRTKESVNDVFKNILTVTKLKILKFQNSVLLFQLLRSKLDSLTLQIGLPEVDKTPNFVKEYFVPLQIIKSDYFESIKNSFAFQRKLEQKMLQNKMLEYYVLKHFSEEIPEVKYLEAKNLVVVPRSLVEEPYFEQRFPDFLLYGRLGIEIAQAIIHSILPYGSLWTSEQKILSPFHTQIKESLRSVENPKNCLANYILGLNLDVLSSRANETALRTLKELSAIKIAYEALMNKNSNKEHVHQPGLEEFEDPALFFVAYSQTQCSDSSSQYQFYQNVVNFALPQRSVLHLAWAQIPEFQKSFECRQDKKVQCKDIF